MKIFSSLFLSSLLPWLMRAQGTLAHHEGSTAAPPAPVPSAGNMTGVWIVIGIAVVAVVIVLYFALRKSR